jgi:hypothetical protein
VATQWERLEALELAGNLKDFNSAWRGEVLIAGCGCLAWLALMMTERTALAALVMCCNALVVMFSLKEKIT